MTGLVDPGAVGLNIFNAFQAGQQQAQQQRAQNALGTYAANPTPENLNALAQYDPQFVMQQKAAQATVQQAQVQREQQQLPVISRLLDHATDENSYQQALGIARQYGLDVSQAPANFDPQWVGGLKQMVVALQTPQGQQALSNAGKIATDEGLQPGTPQFAQRVHDIWLADQQKTIPYQAGGGVAAYNPVTGGVTPIVVPNPGGMPAGAPVKDIPHVASPADAAKLPPGTQFYDPNGVLRMVPGGTAGNGGGNFPNIERYYGQ